MWKQAAIVGLASLAISGTAAAQDANKAATLQKAVIVTNNAQAERAALYDRATLVATRAGVSSDDQLSREELFSILLVLSLKQTKAQHEGVSDN